MCARCIESILHIFVFCVEKALTMYCAYDNINELSDFEGIGVLVLKMNSFKAKKIDILSIKKSFKKIQKKP